jgi:competence protein ComFC
MFTNYLNNILFPNLCTACKRDISTDNRLKICGECYSTIKLLKENTCRKCSRPLDYGGAYCYECRRDGHYFTSLISAAAYTGTVKDLVHKFKYFRQDYLKSFMARLMCDILESKKPREHIDFLAPVPIHWFKELTRGYNQSELLAREISKTLSIPFQDALLKKRFTFSQTKLSKNRRSLNVSGSFTVKEGASVKNKNILLIDDVATTASTLDECSRVLHDAGAKKVFCLTFARD